MATLYDLAEIADAAYGSKSATAYLLAEGIWQPLPGADGYTAAVGDYVGVAYQNSQTREIVIANRGTVPTKFRDLFSDAELTLHVEPRAAIDATTFAIRIATDYPQAAITETGHSLGGYEAQVALAVG